MTDPPDDVGADLAWSYDEAVIEAGAKRPAAAQAAPLLGQEFAGTYEILEVLGRGGMGTVYRARELVGDRHVALKVLSRGGLTAERLERLRREGQLTAALHHPGIVRVHAAGEVNGLPYLAYELVEGARHLGEVLEGLERADRVSLVSDVARAIGFAHQQGVTHRDVKPENVLVDPAGRPRVVDFGLARAAGLETLTRTGTLVGTPSFMAPEQISASPGAIGPHTDVWALGVLLYRSLTGELPFQAPGLIELSVRVCQAAPEPPRSLDSTVPSGMQAVCLKALEKTAGKRYPDAIAFADDLDRALDSRPVTASRSWLPHLLDRSRRFAPGLGFALAALTVAGAALLMSTAWQDDAKQRRLEEEALREAQVLKGDDAQLLGQARAALRAGDADLARRACELLVGRSPRHAEGLILLTRAHLQAGDVANARKVSDALADAHPGSRAEVLRAEIDAASGQDVWTRLREFRRRWPMDTAPRDGLARYLFVTVGAPEAARALLREGRRSPERTQLSAVLKALEPESRAAPPAEGAVSPALRLAGARWLLSEAEREVALARPALDPRFKEIPGALPKAIREARARRDLSATLAWAGDSKQAAAVRARAHVALAVLAGVPGSEGDAQIALALLAVPSHPDALQLRAASRAARGEHEAVLSDLNAAREANARAPSDPNDDPEGASSDPNGARVLRGAVLVREGKSSVSVAFGSGIAARAIEGPRETLLRARALLGLGQGAEALEVLEASPAGARDHPDAFAALLDALRSVGRETEAASIEPRLALLRGVKAKQADDLYEVVRAQGPLKVNSVPISLKRYRSVTALDPLHARARFNLARCRTLRGELLDGISGSLREADRDPTLLEVLCYGTQEVSRATLVLYGVGMEGMEERTPYTERPLHWGTRGFISTMLAECEGNTERLTAGLRDLSAVVGARPGSVWVYVLRGFLWLRAGYADQAEEELRIVEEAAPGMPILVFYRALISAKRQAPADDVLAAIKRARELGYEPLDNGRQARTLPLYPELREYLRTAGFEEFMSSE